MEKKRIAEEKAKMLELKKQELIELTAFVKPQHDCICFLLTFLKEGKVYIHEIYLFSSINECIDKVINYIPKEKYNVGSILFDCSFYMNEAKYIRSCTETPVRMHRAKKQFEERVVNNSQWIRDNIVFRQTDNPDYIQFRKILENGNNDKRNISLSTLLNVAEYYGNKVLDNF